MTSILTARSGSKRQCHWYQKLYFHWFRWVFRRASDALSHNKSIAMTSLVTSRKQFVFWHVGAADNLMLLQGDWTYSIKSLISHLAILLVNRFALRDNIAHKTLRRRFTTPSRRTYRNIAMKSQRRNKTHTHRYFSIFFQAESTNCPPSQGGTFRAVKIVFRFT